MLSSSMHFIRDASTVKSQPPKQVMDGIIRGSLDTFQRGAVHNLLVGGGKREVSAKKVKGPKEVSKAMGHAPKTPASLGFMPYPGAGASKY